MFCSALSRPQIRVDGLIGGAVISIASNLSMWPGKLSAYCIACRPGCQLLSLYVYVFLCCLDATHVPSICHLNGRRPKRGVFVFCRYLFILQFYTLCLHKPTVKMGKYLNRILLCQRTIQGFRPIAIEAENSDFLQHNNINTGDCFREFPGISPNASVTHTRL